MNVVVIDAIFEAVSVLASGNSGVCSLHFYPRMRERGKQLQKFIKYATEEAGFLLSETEIVALPEGPGGFTGLRLGYAAAKAISLASGATVLAVPTLTLLDSSQKYYDGEVISAVYAKRDNFYLQAFKEHKAITSAYDENILTFLEKMNMNTPKRVIGFGLQYILTALKNTQYSHIFHFIETSQYAFPQYILEYVMERRNECKEVKDADGPFYIRKSDAEREI